MRQSNQKSRSRGRNRKPQNPMSRNFESNGPDVKIRGNASHIADKYTTLARDALSNGDRVIAENYLQHAEHYNRIVAAAQQQSEAKAAENLAKAPQPEVGDNAAEEADSNSDASANGKAADVSGESDAPKERKNGNNRRPRRKAAESASNGAEDKSVEASDSDATVDVEAISDDAAKLPGSILGGMVAEES